MREIEAFDMLTLQKVTLKIREHTEGAARTFQGLMKKNISYYKEFKDQCVQFNRREIEK